ncbi:Uncharacterised protein [Mycobacteroides abscessus subsp. abscessus]|nr:Uncharacterised protein [Mycobacteroides abscessus subsp. abscessus]
MARKSSRPLISGPPFSWMATIPIDATASSARSCARVRDAGLTNDRAAPRTRWCASAISGSSG